MTEPNPPLTALCVELTDALRRGDADAWPRTLQAFGSLVMAEARRAGLAGADADDVYQTTWLALHRSLPALRQPDALAAWIGITARREAWRLRRRRRPESLDESHDEPVDEQADSAEISQRIERWSLVREGLAELDERCRELLRRLFVDSQGGHYSEVAQDLGMAVGSIGPTRARCLARLAGWLEGRGLR